MLHKFGVSEESILSNKRSWVIYVADFPKWYGKYISLVEDVIDDYDWEDLRLKISPRVEVRITYEVKKEKIKWVKISKLSQWKVYDVNMTTCGFEAVLKILHIFSELDLKSVSNRSLMLDASIVDSPEELTAFLWTVATDPAGKDKMREVAKNFNLFDSWDIDLTVERKKAVKLFESILNSETLFKEYKEQLWVWKNEEVWQRFFEANNRILWSDIIRVLENRVLDTESITDFLAEAYDWFVDIVELKLPTENFWTAWVYPNSSLTKATMQSIWYLNEIERRMNDHKFIKKLDNCPISKPRITLIYWRSDEWNAEQREAYRVLNSAYHSLTIMSYDHVLKRAKWILWIKW